MLIIIVLYAALIWLVFFRLKWLRFNWVFGSLAPPKDLDPAMLRLGMAGQATVFSDHAGAIGTLASILLFVKAYALYL